MNEEERDQLLIRIDERQRIMHEAFTGLPEKVEKNTSDINWLKWLGTSAVAIMAVVVAVVEWFK